MKQQLGARADTPLPATEAARDLNAERVPSLPHLHACNIIARSNSHKRVHATLLRATTERAGSFILPIPKPGIISTQYAH